MNPQHHNIREPRARAHPCAHAHRGGRAHVCAHVRTTREHERLHLLHHCAVVLAESACARACHARRTAGISMTLLTTEQLVWLCGEITLPGRNRPPEADSLSQQNLLFCVCGTWGWERRRTRRLKNKSRFAKKDCNGAHRSSRKNEKIRFTPKSASSSTVPGAFELSPRTDRWVDGKDVRIP